MMKIQRHNGKTIIQMGSISLKFEDMNRARYNDLRKAIDKFEEDFIKACTKKVKK
jgi:hypothetical protein